MACAGDVPTLEVLAAVTILRHSLPDLKIRVVNVVDLMRLQPTTSIRTALGQRFRRPVHEGQADHLRLSRISMADPPAHLPANQSPEPPRSWIQGRRDDYDSVRHGRAERNGSFPPCDGCNRQAASTRRTERISEAGTTGQTNRPSTVHRDVRRRSSGDSRMEVGPVC